MLSLPDQSGEETLIGELYQRHWLAIFAAIRRTVMTREDAEDILLDVFLAALEHKGLANMSLEHQEAWLRRVASNKCVDFVRKAIRRPTVPLEEGQNTLLETWDNAPELSMLHADELNELRRQLAGLSPEQLEVLRLKFVERRSAAEIGLDLHKSEGAIRTMLSRTLNHLRTLYSKQGKESYHG